MSAETCSWTKASRREKGSSEASVSYKGQGQHAHLLVWSDVLALVYMIISVLCYCKQTAPSGRMMLYNVTLCGHMTLYNVDATFYFIVSGEICVYLMKIKLVSITSELISYHFTVVTDTIYIFTPRFGRLRFSSLFQKWMLPPLQIFEHL